VLAGVALSARAIGADDHVVDNVHSSIVFRVKHNNVTYFYGRFNELSGSFRFDDSDPADSMLEIEIKTESVDTNNKNRDKHLKSPDFFNAKEFPKITFKSTKVKRTDGNMYRVTGDLHVHGVSRPVTADVEFVGSATDRRGRKVAGYEAVLTIKRSEFGMDYALNGIGDEVRIMAGIEGVAK
jgi:polyisoprenoid-binding protein YceI